VDFNPIRAARAFHPETVNRRPVIFANLLFFSIETDTACDVTAAPTTPDVEGHFEANDQNAFI
jgi:hypothetical protein